MQEDTCNPARIPFPPDVECVNGVLLDSEAGSSQFVIDYGAPITIGDPLLAQSKITGDAGVPCNNVSYNTATTVLVYFDMSLYNYIHIAGGTMGMTISGQNPCPQDLKIGL